MICESDAEIYFCLVVDRQVDGLRDGPVKDRISYTRQEIAEEGNRKKKKQKERKRNKDRKRRKDRENKNAYWT